MALNTNDLKKKKGSSRKCIPETRVQKFLVHFSYYNKTNELPQIEKQIVETIEFAMRLTKMDTLAHNHIENG